MAQPKYVDWDGLVYYDGKIKDYIAQRDTEGIKMGGIIPFAELPDPSFSNVNYIYKITDKFTSNEDFEKPDLIYKAGTWVQCANINDTYYYIIFNDNELEGDTPVTPGGDVDLSNYYTKDETNQLIEDVTADIDSLSDEVDSLKQTASELATAIDSNTDAIDGLSTEIANTEAKVDELETALQAVQQTAGSNSEKLFAIESDLVDINSTLDAIPETYATKDELEKAISEIEHPTVDLTGYATEEWVNSQEFAKKSDIPSLEGLASKEYVNKTSVQSKYEVLPVEGMLVQYRDGEVRLNTQRVIPTKQTVGSGGNPNMYYVTFRAFAPEGATQCKEGLNGTMDVDYSDLTTDDCGRQFTTIWAAIASTSDDGATWSKWGDNSTLDKYLGFYYHFEWYNEDTLIGKDKVRVILTNDSCHDDLVPDAVARRIDDKINSISVPQPELFVVDYNAPDFAAALEAYNSGKLLLLTNAAPDPNSYAVMNYVRDDMITFTKFLMSRSGTYGSFNTYYLHNDSNNPWELAKEVKLNKVDAVVDDNNDITGLTIGKNTYDLDHFATTETVNQITENIENIENNYVSNTTLEEKNYITVQEAADTYVTNQTVTDVVTNEVEKQVNEVVTKEIETKVETVIQEKIDAGEITVNADSINYDTW